MKLVLVRPFDDETLVEAVLVQHDDKKVDKAFEAAWEKALVEVKAAEPETWCLDQVYKKLHAEGWNIISMDTVTVTY